MGFIMNFAKLGLGLIWQKGGFIVRWFKGVDPLEDEIRVIIDRFGFEGYGRFMALLSHCHRVGSPHIDEALIVNIAKCNIRGARKYLAIFQECLLKVWAKFGQSLPKLGVSNPRGSIYSNTSNRYLEKKEREESPLSSEINNQVTGSHDKAEPCPADWQPDAELTAWVQQTRPDLNVSAVAEKFRLYWRGQGAKCRDWGARFRLWVMRERPAAESPPKPKNSKLDTILAFGGFRHQGSLATWRDVSEYEYEPLLNRFRHRKTGAFISLGVCVAERKPA